MSEKHNLPAKLTDRGGRAVRKVVTKTRSGVRKVPGPSPNSATNLLVADIAMRTVMRLFRRSVEKGLLGARFDPAKAHEIVEGRTLGKTLLSAAAARVATGSVPGAMLVGGGILGKALLDRTVGRRRAIRKGDRALAEQAEKA
ncbi:hypothetical protein GRI75_09935 [Altererythrobacter soli]|uniref:Uncharacterized protein n=1 Tax=Croceibacterium soli TaxID=1739690 RepID=A0A6I4UTI8_9SPHN|nr:hypothetical protein [Croceibacterium soli]MXP41958.1 hypothetical protein [Croceibacterium soli]